MHRQKTARSAPLPGYAWQLARVLDKGLMPEWGETTAFCWLDAKHESLVSGLPEMAHKQIKMKGTAKTSAIYG